MPFAAGNVTGDLPATPYAWANDTVPATIFMAYPDANGAPSVLNRTLYNASYTVNFKFNDGVQNISLRHYKIGNSVKAQNSTFQPGGPHWPMAFALSNAETRSYLGFMEAIGNILTSSLYSTQRRGTRQAGDANVDDRTKVLQTNLAFTNELYPTFINYSTGVNRGPDELRPIKDVLEELVQNMTISMLNVPEFIGSAETEIQMAVTRYHNTYEYNWRQLCITYGAAVAVALIAISVGFYSLIITGTSYSNKFSTIVRIARDSSLAVFIGDEDRLGQDPLPEYIGRAKFAIDPDRLTEDKSGSGDSSSVRPRCRTATSRNSLVDRERSATNSRLLRSNDNP